MTTAAVSARRLRVSGVVQGVGFRPFVARLAGELGLAGEVGNDTDGVFVEVEGPADALDRFASRLVADAPPLAHIRGVAGADLPAAGRAGFVIAASRVVGRPRTYVSPDVAACDACLAEMWDPADRRYRYPFVNCTDCGPRFTITVRLPYDRPNTTMAGFAMCADCSREYHDPADRRFHAQPVACPACGPRLSWESGTVSGCGSDAALAAALDLLAAGGIVAVKGLGGYHLACDATSSDAVGRLRSRKQRGEKPFAVMVADVATARQLAAVDADEQRLLTGPQRPIVLLRARLSGLSPLVAPSNPYLGVLLAYTPLHHLLLASSGPLVMTSGNLSDEPICFDDGDARRRLAGVADGWLAHDRPIHVPCDDSVVRVEAGAELPIRRSRGYAPLPVSLPAGPVGSAGLAGPVGSAGLAGPPILAAGGELKNACCLGAGGDAWMSQHLGDMGSVESLRALDLAVRHLCDLYAVEAPAVACDAHPGYQTRRWAEARNVPVLLVQHHHAHIASVMAEHAVPVGERVIGVAFDGTGYGADGAIWGGEILVAGYDGFDRVDHLRYVPLPGGDVTIRRPARAALAHLWAAGIPWDADLAPVVATSAEELAVLRRQLERDLYCVPTSSMGRLFDAVSSLLDLRHTVSYEGQAAIELEAAADGTPRRYAFDGTDPAPVLRAAVADLRAGVAPARIALGFHHAVAVLVVEQAVALRSATGLHRVALSGGVWQNVLLVGITRQLLESAGFAVLTHRVVPPNDGGLALGQLAIAAIVGVPR